MKKFILFLNVLLLSASTFAQTAQVVLSDEMKVDPFFMRHLHSDATGHYVLFAERGKGGTMIPIIRKYDNKMKMLFSKEYKVDGKDIYYEDILYAKGKFIWISSKREKKSDVVSYYATPLDMKGIAG
ncbi:MAG: hypothetical protein KDD49_07515, partial [Bacteroidetes bacterium]|nr:hypothetical protein [Bacteroidota bacterium]